MGNSTWDSNSRSTYATMSSVAKKASTYREVFKNTSIAKDLDPKGVVLRESVDSEDHNPNSNAIIIALDITGSMGKMAHKIAHTGLGEIVELIIERAPVVDPHIMCAAVGDAYYDECPFQITQFEADIKIAQQLQEIYVEGRGGANGFESYNLPHYFAAKHTKIDCFDKRGNKGYLFTIGDELPPEELTKEHIKEIFGDDVQSNYSMKETLEMAQEQYHVFHLNIEEQRGPRVKQAWVDLIGKRCLSIDNCDHLPQIIVSAIQVSEGADIEDVIESWEIESIRKSVNVALSGNSGQ